MTDGPDGNWPTPEPPHRINQIFLEPILFEHSATRSRNRILSHTAAEATSIEDGRARIALRDLDVAWCVSGNAAS